MTQEEFDEDLGHPFAALEISCHNLFDPTQQGFILLYYQFPIDSTISRPLKPELSKLSLSTPTRKSRLS
ncbi:hypothetical protein N7491_001817 [Penicillium cf. griseofulvum]|nr:hypothetical protein N7491_001817 [Penicillium cf. griseofulvum]